MEYMDEGSATVAKDALHNYKLDGENKIKVIYPPPVMSTELLTVILFVDYFCEEVNHAVWCFHYIGSSGVRFISRCIVVLILLPCSKVFQRRPWTLHPSFSVVQIR